MSYDGERLQDHDMSGLDQRPNVHSRRITSTAPPVELYDERLKRRKHEMLDREIQEREDAVAVRERARRDRADLEKIYRGPPRP